MELSDLVGPHELTGVDTGILSTDGKVGRYEDASQLLFILDGQTYCVTEDPDDGYRSSMRDIELVSDVAVKNTFPSVTVMGVMGSTGHYGSCSILQLIDAVTGKIVLEVGTENIDDYYPCYVGNFTPEHMVCNAPKG